MSRRLEKVSRTIRDTVSGVIQNQLSDPRIRGLVSITRLKVAADFSTAQIYLSILGTDTKQQQLSVEAIQHAAGFIQSHLANVLTTRSCPTLSFTLDDSLKKGSEVLNIINRLAEEYGPVSSQEDEKPLIE
jgi:ribosome-binding factor A